MDKSEILRIPEKNFFQERILFFILYLIIEGNNGNQPVNSFSYDGKALMVDDNTLKLINHVIASN